MKHSTIPGMATACLQTPLGVLRLEANDDGLAWVGFRNAERSAAVGEQSPRALLHIEATRNALDEYFAGRRTQFDDLTLALRGTAFQLAVWHTLIKIPFGVTTSYGAIARQLHNPKAMRAVGLANGKNPIPIIVPCHRVIGASGALTGFSGGINIKKWLLHFEGVALPSEFAGRHRTREREALGN